MKKITKSLLRMLFWISLFCLWVFSVYVFPSCSKHHPHEPPVIVPPDTVVVIDTLIIVNTDTIFLVCDTFDMTIEFMVIGDQSAPNVYAYFRNGVEVGRFIVDDTFAEPTEITFQFIFERITLGDVITIKKIEGSRAETIGSAIISISCSGG